MITPLSVLQPRIPRELGFPAARLEVPISSGGFVRGAAGRASAVRQEGWGPDSILSSRLAEAVLHIPGVSAVGLLGGLAGGRVSGYHGFRRGERDGWMNRKNRRFFRSVKLNCIIHNTRKTMISHIKLCKISISSIVLLEDEITSFD